MLRQAQHDIDDKVPGVMDEGLGAFLRSVRARMDPLEAGLPARTGRGGGLRREDVAELIGVSDVWYKRFESGRGRMALSKLCVLADVLHLSANERERLFYLARPEFRHTSQATVRDALSGCGAQLDGVRGFARSARTATHPSDVGAAAVRALATSDVIAYWQEPLVDGWLFRACAGPGADRLEGYEQRSWEGAHIVPEIERGALVWESELRRSPSAAFRSRERAYGVRSYAAMMVAAGGQRFIIGIASPEAGEPSPMARFAIETIATTAELALIALDRT